MRQKKLKFDLKAVVAITIVMQLCLTTAFAQTTIKGTVIDAAGRPLPGVSVTQQGNKRGAVTDLSGNYSLVLTNNSSFIIFSSIGFETKSEAVKGRNTISITLNAQNKEMDQVVVTALGIKKESRKLGYAASAVKVDEITRNRTTNVMTSLEGKIAGLEIAPPTAGAGASNRIRLRGQSGFAGQTNSPLIVINGLPMDQGARSAEGGSPAIDQGDDLQQINQDDIESMTVLKGATAAALYGSRASNGAIIITTKSGAKNSRFGVEFTSSFAADEIMDFTHYQTQYGTGSNGVRPATQAKAQSTGNLSWGEKYDGVPTVQYDGILRPYSPDKNRFKEFYRTGTTLVNTIALSGGNALTSYRVSFSNQDATGISPGNSYHKKIFNLGLNSKVTEKLTLQANINYTHEENNNPPLVGAQGIGFSSFLHRIPLTISIATLKTSVVGPDGSLYPTNPFNALLTNPYYLIGRMFNYTKRDRLLGTVSLRYDFFKWLYFQGRVNADFGYSANEFNLPHGVGVPLRNSSNTGWVGNYSANTNYNKQMNMDFLLGTTHKVGDFTIDVSFGGNMYTVKNNITTQSVTDFVAKDIYSIGNGITKSQDFRINRFQVNSLYAFADFGYRNFLYLNVTDRTDFFSVLTPPRSLLANPKNSFNYPSVSASFIFSELLPKIKWLNYGKLRMSYADVGNVNGVSPFSSQLTYTIDQQMFGTYPIATIANTSNPNPHIKPYSVSEKEIGLELRTLSNRLNFDVAIYDKRTNDQILPVDLSPASGYNSTTVNIGKLKNTGLEVAVDGTPVKTSNFIWNISVNSAYNTSKVLALNPGQTRQVVVFFNGTGNEFLGSLVYDVGKEMNQLIANTYLRNNKGQIMLNSAGRLLPSASPVNYGSANAKVIGGIANIFQYKNLSLLVSIDGKFGGKVLSSTALNGLRSGMSQKSLVGRNGVVFDGVLPNGNQNTISVSPQIFYADYRTQQIGDPFVFSSDFVKLRNITLTYDLTGFMIKNVKFIKGLTLSAFCRNAAVLMKHIPDVDPEAFASSADSRLGYEQHTEPTTRTFGLNLNVKF
ncbi:SusC/RagA family TonB-linked outer membrane protein [Flavitalea sp. BT771]|uniref:SusC/RagA family TonB-linked outer membrane protein n=1 Tax=Flavitalea sp. BT771 TaxID=3063329 RepID=UPI0026E20070|nr:SusC/RagA family TonB-linked outer membrane protein [Flavitalea sp. BT771]MDO6431674.1 SusC/RagA family TonB-linked outer membrane protein [Flavitalea sp. BT771]MDV6220582.1 SusC/RagA family TonB-linked outer membrane protein [Flavitalea sp. BT771]